MSDKLVTRPGFRPNSQSKFDRVNQAIADKARADGLHVKNGQQAMPAEVFAGITAILNGAMQGKSGQMEIGTINNDTGGKGPLIRIIAVPASMGELKDGFRTLTIPEVFGAVKNVDGKPVSAVPDAPAEQGANPNA
jgi:hypothetical protein